MVATVGVSTQGVADQAPTHPRVKMDGATAITVQLSMVSSDCCDNVLCNLQRESAIYIKIIA